MTTTTQEALLLSWMKHHCDRGQVQIARSLLGTGYEVAIVPRVGKARVKTYSGEFNACITQAMYDDA